MNGKEQAFVNGRLDHLEALFFFAILSLFFSVITFILFLDSMEMVPSFCLCLRASLPSDPKYLFLVRSLPHFSLAI